MIVRFGEEVEFGEDAGDMRLDGFLGHDQLPGNGPVGPSLGHLGQHLTLPLGELGEATVGRLAAQEVGDDVRVEHRSTGGDPLDRVDQRSHVDDAVFQQIAETGGVGARQIQGEAAFDRLREEQDTESRQRFRSRVAVSAPSWVKLGGIRMSMIATSG